MASGDQKIDMIVTVDPKNDPRLVVKKLLKRGCRLDGIIKSKLDAIFREYDAHIQKLRRASGILAPIFSININSLNELPGESVSIPDQFLYRFMKIQDSRSDT